MWSACPLPAFSKGEVCAVQRGCRGPWEEDAFISLHGGKKLVIWKAGRQRGMILQQPEKGHALRQDVPRSGTMSRGRGGKSGMSAGKGLTFAGAASRP